MGHCAPRIAAVNAATDVCGVCAPDFAPGTGSLQELQQAGFLLIPRSSDGSELFY